MNIKTKIAFLLAALLCALPAAAQPEVPMQVDAGDLPAGAETVATGLVRPWSIAFFSDGTAVITERGGDMRLLRDGKLSDPLKNVPTVFISKSKEPAQGMQDVAVGQDGRLIFCYHVRAPGERSSHVRLSSAWLSQDRHALVDVQTIYDALPIDDDKAAPGACRIALGQGRDIFLSIGVLSIHSTIAQRDDASVGKIFQLYLAGGRWFSAPVAKGFRNPEGLTFHDGNLWETEHGPMGGDELNLILPGRNYGWPLQTYGVDYTGDKIGDPQVPGMTQPTYYWKPSIAPSGLAFCKLRDGETRLFAGALKFETISSLNVIEGRVLHESRVAMGDRIRDVRCHDGKLWVLTDSDKGRLIRMDPFE